MNEKLPATKAEWIDPDDAPELTEEFFEHGEWKIGDRTVSQKEGKAAFRKALRAGRPKSEVRKVSTTIRLDQEVLEWFKSQGKGYQTRISEILKAYMKAQKQGKVEH